MHTTQRGVRSLDSESATHWHEQATLVAPSDPDLSSPDIACGGSTSTSCECWSRRSMGDQCIQQAPVQPRPDRGRGGTRILNHGVNENDQLENTHFQKLVNTSCVPTSHPTADTEWASGNCDTKTAGLVASREDNAAPSPRKLFSNVMNTTIPQILGNGGPTQININLGSGSLNTVGKNQGNVWAELFARSSLVGEVTTTVPRPPLKGAPSGQHNGSHGSGNNGSNHPHEPRPVHSPLFSTHQVDLVIVFVFVLLLVLAFLGFIAILVDALFGC